MPHDLPARKSTNPALGVKRCGCGDVLTIHQSRGKRANFYYSICDTCGTDQRTGAPVQKRLAEFFPTLSDLTQYETEKSQIKPSEAPQTRRETSSESASLENQGIESETSRKIEPTANGNETDHQAEESGGFWVRGLFVALGIVAGSLTGRAITR